MGWSCSNNIIEEIEYKENKKEIYIIELMDVGGGSRGRMELSACWNIPLQRSNIYMDPEEHRMTMAIEEKITQRIFEGGKRWRRGLD